MGQTQTIPPKNDIMLKHQLQLERMMKVADSINTDTTKLQAQSEKLLEEINKRQIPPQLIKTMDAHFNAQSECNIPPVVLWLSSTRRRKCKNARILAFNEAAKLSIDIIELTQLQSLQKQIDDHIKDLDIVNKCQS